MDVMTPPDTTGGEPSRVPDEREIAEHLARRGAYTYSRSSGPGGQRRDKVATRVQLLIPAEAADGLPEELSRRVVRGLGLGTAPLVLQSEKERSRERNRAIVLAELARRVQQALAPPPPPRRPTRPSRGSVDRRIASKQRRGATKAAPQTPQP